MSRADITADLSLRLEKHIDPRNDPRIYWAKEVTFDYATSRAKRIDYMLFKPKNSTVSGIEKGDFYCYEIKSSVEDFKSKNGHNFLGDYNYYVMPESVFNEVQNTIQRSIGIYCPYGNGLKSIRKATRKDRAKPMTEMLLMMYRSSRRETVKIRRKK